jgi:hypothetical protein
MLAVGSTTCKGARPGQTFLLQPAVMAQRVLRFGIGAADGARAATWRLWTETARGESDFYLACRSLGGHLKASLHQSGAWHVAYSKQIFEEKVQGIAPHWQDRFIQKWPRPAEMAPGVTLAFRIVTPFSALTESSRVRDDPAVIWLPNAPEGKATEIDILLVKPTTLTAEWPGRRSMGTSLIGSLPLSNGDTVWAVYWVIDMPNISGLSEGAWRFFKGVGKEDLQGGNLRALVLSDAPDGSRVIYDCAVKRGAPAP